MRSTSEREGASVSDLRAARAFGAVAVDALQRVPNPFGTLLSLGGAGVASAGGFGIGIGGVNALGVPGTMFPAFGGAHGRVPLGAVSAPGVGGGGGGPVYVNAKQYHAIVRRRKQRAKLAEKLREAGENAGVRVKYESRVAHAKNRVRGANGQYLTREELLAGAGGPEARERALAREEQIKELARKREARKIEREAKRRAKLAAQRNSKERSVAAATSRDDA